MNKFHKRLFFATLNKVIWPPNFFNCMHGLKSAILAIFQKLADWLDYHQKLRLVFCHSDTDPSSVFRQ